MVDECRTHLVYGGCMQDPRCLWWMNAGPTLFSVMVDVCRTHLVYGGCMQDPPGLVLWWMYAGPTWFMVDVCRTHLVYGGCMQDPPGLVLWWMYAGPTWFSVMVDVCRTAVSDVRGRRGERPASEPIPRGWTLLHLAVVLWAKNEEYSIITGQSLASSVPALSIAHALLTLYCSICHYLTPYGLLLPRTFLH
jgi:hypothetical protein